MLASLVPIQSSSLFKKGCIEGDAPLDLASSFLAMLQPKLAVSAGCYQLDLLDEYLIRPSRTVNVQHRFQIVSEGSEVKV